MTVDAAMIISYLKRISPWPVTISDGSNITVSGLVNPPDASQLFTLYGAYVDYTSTTAFARLAGLNGYGSACLQIYGSSSPTAQFEVYTSSDGNSYDGPVLLFVENETSAFNLPPVRQATGQNRKFRFDVTGVSVIEVRNYDSGSTSSSPAVCNVHCSPSPLNFQTKSVKTGGVEDSFTYSVDAAISSNVGVIPFDITIPTGGLMKVNKIRLQGIAGVSTPYLFKAKLARLSNSSSAIYSAAGTTSATALPVRNDNTLVTGNTVAGSAPMTLYSSPPTINSGTVVEEFGRVQIYAPGVAAPTPPNIAELKFGDGNNGRPLSVMAGQKLALYVVGGTTSGTAALAVDIEVSFEGALGI
jgi:hypothetical protein